LFFKNDLIERLGTFEKANLDLKEYAKYDSIEAELLKDKNMTMPLKYKILSSDMNFRNKKVVYEKFLIFAQMCPDDNNYAKLNDWFEWALSIPTIPKQISMSNINSDRNKFNCDLRTKLDNSLYGIPNVKQQICTIVNDYLTLYNSPNILEGVGNQMALVGSPGVGKTLIIRTLAECLDIPFQQISLGGVKDSSFLEGHSYTYEGAKPGAIVEALRQMKFTNGIIFFDEFDKLGESEKGMEVANSLLHVIDSTQNSTYRDKYLSELDVDLSKIWFIYSMNNDKMINGILRDRMKPIIKVDDYTDADKIQIVKRHLLPNTLKIYSYTKEDIDIDDSTITYIIQRIEKENGVRELKQSIREIVRNIHFLKTNVLKDGTLGTLQVKFDVLTKINIKQKVMITKDLVDICLPENKKDIPLSMYS